jgi:putative endonuclease
MDRYFVYILYSQEGKVYYTGQSMNVDLRLEQHLDLSYPNAWTSRYNDWKVFISIECETRQQALSIESHLKKMKSKTYYENLAKYPEMRARLVSRFAVVPGSSR